MSTSPSYSFLVAWASADSTAPNTTSRSTFFSREIASTSINNSRFMSRVSCLPGLPALEIHHRREARLLQFVEREAQHLQRRRLPLAAHALPGLGLGLVAPHHLPAALFGAAQLATKLLAVGGHLAGTRGAHRRLERDVHQLAGETLEVLLVAQRPVDARRGHLEPLVVDALDFQRVLQLARH